MVQPVFVFDTDILTRFTNPRDRRLTFLVNTLHAMHRDLLSQGGGLLVLYGSAKALVTAFTGGLRQRLAKAGVNVLTIKHGFVDTPMTAAFPKGPLWASADTIAAGIVAAIERRRSVVYLPGFWRLIMLVIRHIPEFVFKKLSL